MYLIVEPDAPEAVLHPSFEKGYHKNDPKPKVRFMGSQ